MEKKVKKSDNLGGVIMETACRRGENLAFSKVFVVRRTILLGEGDRELGLDGWRVGGWRFSGVCSS